MINKNCKIEKFENPFPYIKIQNFLEKDFYENLEFAFPKIDDFKRNERSLRRMDYDTTYGDSLYAELQSKNDNYKKFHDYVYSNEFINYFLDLFKTNILNELNKNFLIENILNYPINSNPFEVDGIIGKEDLTKSLQKFLYPRLDLGSGIEGYGKK